MTKNDQREHGCGWCVFQPMAKTLRVLKEFMSRSLINLYQGRLTRLGPSRSSKMNLTEFD